MKKVILLILILLILFSLVACGVDEPGYNFATEKSTFDTTGEKTLQVKVMGDNLYTFDLNDYSYSLMSDISLKVRNLKTNELWRFPYYTIQYIKVTE